QTERHELADAVVRHVPTDRPVPFGQELHDPQVGERVDLQSTELARNHQAVEAGGVELLDDRLRQALLALDLLAIAADGRWKRRGRLTQGWSVDIGRQALGIVDGLHGPDVPPVERTCQGPPGKGRGKVVWSRGRPTRSGWIGSSRSPSGLGDLHMP